MKKFTAREVAQAKLLLEKVAKASGTQPQVTKPTRQKQADLLTPALMGGVVGGVAADDYVGEERNRLKAVIKGTLFGAGGGIVGGGLGSLAGSVGGHGLARALGGAKATRSLAAILGGAGGMLGGTTGGGYLGGRLGARQANRPNIWDSSSKKEKSEKEPEESEKEPEESEKTSAARGHRVQALKWTLTGIQKSAKELSLSMKVPAGNKDVKAKIVKAKAENDAKDKCACAQRKLAAVILKSEKVIKAASALLLKKAGCKKMVKKLAVKKAAPRDTYSWNAPPALALGMVSGLYGKLVAGDHVFQKVSEQTGIDQDLIKLAAEKKAFAILPIGLSALAGAAAPSIIDKFKRWWSGEGKGPGGVPFRTTDMSTMGGYSPRQMNRWRNLIAQELAGGQQFSHVLQGIQGMYRPAPSPYGVGQL